MPSPTPTASPSMLGIPLDNLGPSLTMILQVIAVIGALYGFARGIRDVIAWLRRPRLTAYMSDDIWLVAESNQSEFAINMQIVVYNPGNRLAVLRRLESTLVRPAFSSMYPAKTFNLIGRGFLTSNPSGFEGIGPVFAKPVAPHETEVIGIQLRGEYQREDSSRPHCFDWFPGHYAIHLWAVVNNRRLRLSPIRGCTFDLNDGVAGHLSPTTDFAPAFTASARLTC
jgi:hypothetical protein